jgi:hypothetical protein
VTHFYVFILAHIISAPAENTKDGDSPEMHQRHNTREQRFPGRLAKYDPSLPPVQVQKRFAPTLP